MLRTETIEHAVQRNRDGLFRFGSALIFIVCETGPRHDPLAN